MSHLYRSGEVRQKRAREGLDGARVIDFNLILRVFNGLFALAPLIVSFGGSGAAVYTDRWTSLLAVVFGVQTHIALLLERRMRNPLVIVLAFVMIGYFSLRIVTLELYSASLPFNRFVVTPQDLNFSIIFIILANCALYAGLMLARSTTTLRTDPGHWRGTTANRALILLACSFVVIYTPLASIVSALPLVVLVMSLLSQNIVITVVMAYCLLFRKTMSSNVLYLFVALILCEAFLHFLSGSRSALQVLFLNYLIVSLAISGAFTIPKRGVYLTLFLMPLILPIAVESFSLSTYIRASKEGSQFRIQEAAEITRDYRLTGAADTEIESKLIPLFDRMGFLDYSADLIMHREAYSAVVQPMTYVRSLVDNLLTPGFDVFDQPKISNALRAVYDRTAQLTKADVISGYQSDQLGLYGELYVLFGYFSLPIFFIVGLLFSNIYIRGFARDPFVRVVSRMITLFTFMAVINSFGFDWVLCDLVFFVTGAFFLERLVLLSRPLVFIGQKGDSIVNLQDEAIPNSTSAWTGPGPTTPRLPTQAP